MSERRQAFRRDPIIVVLDENHEVEVAPVTWIQRNDFGDELVRQHVAILNEAVDVWINDTGTPQLALKFSEKFTDPLPLLKTGLPEKTFKELKVEELYQNQIIEILLAVLEVNGLEKFKALVDPNLETPTELGGLSSLSQLGTDSNPTESGPDSSSPDLTALRSDSSLDQNLSPSSSNSTEEKSMSTTGT
jgi:hypothetical protein